MSAVEKKILRLLIVDQSPDDTELAVTAIRKCGYMLKTQRVQDLAGMQAAIDKGQWDVVISEFSLPHFSAQMAHDLLKKAGREPPFIILTRAISDNDLVAAMRSYAQDVVMKERVVKLAPVIERELRAADDRRRLHDATARVQESENKSRAVIDGSREALCYLQDGMHLDANHTYLDLFGYESLEALTGVPVMNLIDKADQKRF
ncbi:MAG: response regulator, partial [Pseudomonadota bacterium]